MYDAAMKKEWCYPHPAYHQSTIHGESWLSTRLYLESLIQSTAPCYDRTVSFLYDSVMKIESSFFTLDVHYWEPSIEYTPPYPPGRS